MRPLRVLAARHRLRHHRYILVVGATGTGAEQILTVRACRGERDGHLVVTLGALCDRGKRTVVALQLTVDGLELAPAPAYPDPAGDVAWQRENVVAKALLADLSVPGRPTVLAASDADQLLVDGSASLATYQERTTAAVLLRAADADETTRRFLLAALAVGVEGSPDQLLAVAGAATR